MYIVTAYRHFLLALLTAALPSQNKQSYLPNSITRDASRARRRKERRRTSRRRDLKRIYGKQRRIAWKAAIEEEATCHFSEWPAPIWLGPRPRVWRSKAHFLFWICVFLCVEMVSSAPYSIAKRDSGVFLVWICVFLCGIAFAALGLRRWLSPSPLAAAATVVGPSVLSKQELHNGDDAIDVGCLRGGGGSGFFGTTTPTTKIRTTKTTRDSCSFAFGHGIRLPFVVVLRPTTRLLADTPTLLGSGFVLFDLSSGQVEHCTKSRMWK